MLSNRARPDLLRHLAKLRGWERQVPERARRFHSVRRDLEARVSNLESRWWQFWIADDELEHLAQNTAANGRYGSSALVPTATENPSSSASRTPSNVSRGS